MSRLTRTDQKSLSFARSTWCSFKPGAPSPAGCAAASSGGATRRGGYRTYSRPDSACRWRMRWKIETGAGRCRIASCGLLKNEIRDDQLESRRGDRPPLPGTVLARRDYDIVGRTRRQVADDAGLDVDARLHDRPSSHPEHLHHLVAEVVDDLDGDAARLRAVERTRDVAVERLPRVSVDLGFQRRLERLEGSFAPRKQACRTKKLSSL